MSDTMLMPMTVPVEAAGHDLSRLIKQCRLGETITLVDMQGLPMAVMVPLRPAWAEPKLSPDWLARWDTLTQKVSRAWTGNKSAVEILAEMRR